MASSTGLSFLKIVLELRITPEALEQHRVVPELFSGDARSGYDFAVSHFRQHGSWPSVQTVERHGGLHFPDNVPEEPLTYWVGELRKQRKIRLILEAIRSAESAIEDQEADTAAETLQSLNTRLWEISQEFHPTVFEIRDLFRMAVDSHNETQRMLGPRGVPFGIPYLDMVSGGAQPGDTVAVVGRPGMGKSYFLLHMALSAWQAGFNVLFLTMEMPPRQISRRLLAMAVPVGVTRLRRGELSRFAMDMVEARVEDLIGVPQRFYLVHGTLNQTVEDILTWVHQYHPDVIYIDGAYLLRTSRKDQPRWEKVSDTAEFMKMMSLEINLPVISTYQFNRKGAGSLSNIGLSDAVGQLASIVIGIQDDERDELTSDDRMSPIKYLKLMKGREGEKGTVMLEFDLTAMSFQQIRVIEGVQIDDIDESVQSLASTPAEG